MEVIRTFSKRQKNGRLKYYNEVKCSCGKEFITRRDCSAKSCGCIRIANAKKRRQGLPAYNRLLTNEQVLISSARMVYRTSHYNDADISFDEFIKLSEMPCHYCGVIKANKMHIGIKKTGEQRFSRRKYSDGTYHNVIAHGAYIKDGWFEYNGLDRVDSTGLHSKNNVVPCCKTCNFMKTNKTQAFFLEQIERIYKWQQNKILTT